MNLKIKLHSTLILMILSLIIVTGCKSDVENIQEEIDKNIETKLSESLKPVVSTMSFYLYAVPENYWYPDGTTAKEMIEDGLKLGYRKLGQLDEDISSIQTNNSEITEAIDTLHNRIKKSRMRLRDAQKAMEKVNSIFGFGLYGGMSTLYDFLSLFGGNENSNDEDNPVMPKDVLEAFDNLKDAIRKANFDFLTQAHDFETKAISTRHLSIEQQTTIRFYLKQKIRSSINLYYTGSDTTVRNEATERLLNNYDKLSQ